MILNLTTSHELQLQLDPVATEDQAPSVAFDITAEFSMPFQRVSITNKECWFSYDDLRQFEQDLGALIEQTAGHATLKNMSEKPILQLERNDRAITTRIYAGDTAGIGNVSLEVSGYSPELSDMLNKLKEYPKWW